ncbi:MAG: hypothetical protein NTW21_00955 [Verrucomicrobia bacterium]|nr:hypothetical protein [Verrucomicrobiota bacterium]
MRKSLPADVLLMYRLGDFYEMFSRMRKRPRRF